MKLDIENRIKLLFDKFFWGQHPEAALRYFPVVSEIKKFGLQNSKILEIGSGSIGITPYLRRKIDAIDTDFSGPKSDFVNKIKGTGIKLPFKNDSYDVTISVDVIEHIKPNEREKAVCEMLRVTRRLAVIVVPCGSDSERQDTNLNNYWQKIIKTKNKFLEEHTRNGLPKIDEILVYIDKSKRALNKQGTIKSYPNLNLELRNILMRTWITNNKYVYYLYLKGFLLLLPVLKLCNFGKTYRRVFVIEFHS